MQEPGDVSSHSSKGTPEAMSQLPGNSIINSWMGQSDASKLWNVKVIVISESERWSFIYSPSSQAENYNRIWHLIKFTGQFANIQF